MYHVVNMYLDSDRDRERAGEPDLLRDRDTLRLGDRDTERLRDTERECRETALPASDPLPE